MTKFKTFSALCLLGLCVSACGSSGTNNQAPGDNAGSQDEGGAFSPSSGSTADSGTSKTEDTSPQRVDPSPVGDDADADEDAGTPAPSEPSEEPVADTGTMSDTGSSAPADTGSAVEDTAPPTAPVVSPSCAALAADLSARLLLPQSKTPESEWDSLSGMGPAAATYPTVAIPSGCDRVTFMRARVLAAAKHYIGLPYQHHHVPGYKPSHGPGLDCSNYSAWVYNFGLGIKFTSNIKEQADGPGRKLSSSEKLQPGDLLYLADSDGSGINHVMMLVDDTHIIDDTSLEDHVDVRPFTGRYKDRYAYARRVIE